jgi:four helix bundle protein
MNEQQFKDRTKKFALRVIKVVEALPRKQTAQVIGKQLLRSGTSVGANYRAACRAKSNADIIHKLSIVEEEADESLFWMELLIEAELMRKGKLASLMAEADEIIAMIVSSIKTLRGRHRQIRNPK